MRLLVQPRCLSVSGFLWRQTCFKSNRFQGGGCHESKLQLELKISVDVHPQSTKSESKVAVKLSIASYSDKLINIHSHANPTNPPHFAWVLQTDISLPSVSAMGFMEIDLWQFYLC